MIISAISFTDAGYELGERLKGLFNTGANTFAHERCEKGRLAAWTDLHFIDSDALVFIGATGIAVRAIAPFVEKKTSDPAVVVVDEQGTFAISLLSGHIGGANALASSIALAIGATPVITTATDVNGVFAVDTWAKSCGIKIMNPERIVNVSSELLSDRPVLLINEFFTLGLLPRNVAFHCAAKASIHLTYHSSHQDGALHLVPPVISLGIGCRRNTTKEAIAAEVDALLAEADVLPEAIRNVASVDIKAAEPGLVAFCEERGWPLVTYSADELLAAPGKFTPSQFVKETVGVDNVCERSAVLASDGGTVIAPKHANNGVTCALAAARYSVCFKEGGIK